MLRSPLENDHKTTVSTATTSRPAMTSNRRSSWMDEVGSTVPRRPSYSGAAAPFMPSSAHAGLSLPSNISSSRSQSFSAVQTPNDLAHRVETTKWFPINEEAVDDEPEPDFEPLNRTTSSGNPRRLSTPLISWGLNPNPWNNVWSHPQPNLIEVHGYPRGLSSASMPPKPATLPHNLGPSHTDHLVTATTAPLFSSAKLTQFERNVHVASMTPLNETANGWENAAKAALYTSVDEGPISRRPEAYSPAERPRYNLITSTSYYAVVEFKRYRTEVYQYHASWGMDTKEGLMVVVEADRGVDLGKVVFIATTPSEAREYKKLMNKTHYQALLSHSMTSQPPRDESDIAFNQYYDFNMASAHVGGFAAGNGALPPRSIKRIATDSEVAQLSRKQAFEDKARRMAIITAKKHGMTAQSMEILDAEFQYDFNKLTIYFLSPHYLHFNALVADLFKLFKTRIWMSALNPAACTPGFHAVMQSAAVAASNDHETTVANQWFDSHSQFRSEPNNYTMPQRIMHPTPMGGGEYGAMLAYST